MVRLTTSFGAVALLAFAAIPANAETPDRDEILGTVVEQRGATVQALRDFILSQVLLPSFPCLTLCVVLLTLPSRSPLSCAMPAPFALLPPSYPLSAQACPALVSSLLVEGSVEAHLPRIALASPLPVH